MTLVTSRIDRKLVEGEYYERHHAIPKCLGGKDKKTVNLTAREHYIAHWLLTKMFKEGTNKRKMLHAFNAMAMNSNGQQRNLTSSQYERVRKAYSIAVKEQWKDPEFRKMKSEKTKEQWKDPEFRKMKSKKAKKQMEEQWKDPEFQKMQNERLKKLWKDPEFRKMKSEKAKKQMEEQWKDPGYRKMMNEKNSKSWTFIFNGKEITITNLKAWCKKNNLNYLTVRSRIYKNLPITTEKIKLKGGK